MEVFTPRDEKDAVDVIRAALSNGRPLDIQGRCSRSGLGRPTAADAAISTKGLTGVTLYEPSELVLTARAGTPIKDVAALLDQHGQELAFEPIDHSALYGILGGSGTIGGLVAANASGPRRIKAGAARDHVLGFRAVSGRGEVFKSGGRVMKNVTGYDMSKLIAGAMGTLGLITEVTIKVMPKPETETTVIAKGLSNDEAVRRMTWATALPLEISSVAHLPAPESEKQPRLKGQADGLALTQFRLEGPEISVKERTAALTALLESHVRDIETVTGEGSRTIWAAVRDCATLVGPDDILWRISTAPASGFAVVEAIAAEGVSVSTCFFDWAGGLIWLAVPRDQGAEADKIRRAVNNHGGHATLVRADAAERLAVPVYHPQPTALASLTARIRRSLDPELIMNRGRMREDL